MAKGNPNDETMKVNFIAKVWDDKQEKYVPIYILPDATSEVKGGVYLSDAVDSDSDAATGVVAATPAAVKKLADAAKNYVSKIEKQDQEIQSNLLPDETLSHSLGSDSNRWYEVYVGTVKGNIQFTDPRKIGIKNGEAAEASVSFDGSQDVTIELSEIDGSTITTGMIPTSVIPHGNLLEIENVGSAIEPVYFEDGLPKACGDYLGVTKVNKNQPEEEHVLFWIQPEDDDYE